MTMKKESLAKVLLAVTQQQAVADTLFRHAGDDVEKLRDIPLSRAACQPGEKLSAKRATTLAANSVDQRHLHELARKDSRLGVLRAIARNPAIDESTVNVLVEKACKKRDRDIFGYLDGNAEARDAVSAVFLDWLRSDRDTFELHMGRAADKRLLATFGSLTVLTDTDFKLLYSFEPRDTWMANRRLLQRYVAGQLTFDGVDPNDALRQMAQVFTQQYRPTAFEFYQEVLDGMSLQRLLEIDLVHLGAGAIALWPGDPDYNNEVATVEADDVAVMMVLRLIEDCDGDTGTARRLYRFLSSLRIRNKELQRDVFHRLIARETAVAHNGMLLRGTLAANAPCLFDVDEIVEAIDGATPALESLNPPSVYYGSCLSKIAFKLNLADGIVGYSVNTFGFAAEYRVSSYMKKKLFSGADDNGHVAITVEHLAEVRRRMDAGRTMEDFVDTMVKGMKAHDHLLARDTQDPVQVPLVSKYPQILDIIGVHEETPHALERQIEHYFDGDSAMYDALLSMTDVLHEQPLSDMLNGIRVLYGGESLPGPFDSVDDSSVDGSDVSTDEANIDTVDTPLPVGVVQPQLQLVI